MGKIIWWIICLLGVATLSFTVVLWLLSKKELKNEK